MALFARRRKPDSWLNSAQSTDEYRVLETSNNVVVVTDKTPAHSQVESLAKELQTGFSMLLGYYYYVSIHTVLHLLRLS
ncbi:LOW QUALITY PROTEIN: hypothetical protein PHMEG_00018163 [Phytophthora megakarya]|uniref:Uncharacterized protein n=1 Tax=Phytophthora megakarya TaxID=4795 RepID=A0A225VVI2_9STRA|nr:LOW QUALITY PROTEIN: hypothetical protein PHMEG_00018163 [Phytophthora megakarya]